jgi:biotin carboxyl carrier protein
MRPAAFELEVEGLVRKVQVAHDGGRFEILLDGVPHSVDAAAIEPGRWSLLMSDGRSHEVVIVANGHEGAATVLVDGSVVPIGVRDPRRRRDAAGAQASAAGPVRILAPMPGKVVRVLVAPGDTVSARQSVIVVEAMKMENELRAPRAGIVGEVLVREGALVEAGTLLLTIG